MFVSRECPPFRRDVAIVKGVKRRAEFFDEFKSRAHAVLRVLTDSVPSSHGRMHRARAERIAARAAKRVPVNDREAQMIAHRFALDDFVGVVMFEGERVFGFRAFVGDGPNLREGSFRILPGSFLV